jgi:hypothetical protein
MKNHVSPSNPSTLQEWANFLNVLNGNKNQGSPLLQKAQSAQRIVMHLEKQFSKVEQQPVFRRLGRHTQLVLHFS